MYGGFICLLQRRLWHQPTGLVHLKRQPGSSKYAWYHGACGAAWRWPDKRVQPIPLSIRPPPGGGGGGVVLVTVTPGVVGNHRPWGGMDMRGEGTTIARQLPLDASGPVFGDHRGGCTCTLMGSPHVGLVRCRSLQSKAWTVPAPSTPEPKAKAQVPSEKGPLLPPWTTDLTG